MTEEVLIKVVMFLCMNVSPDPEMKVVCFEEYTNCAVGTGGKIMSREDFQIKCVDKKADK